jgi:hypothetical protein
MALPVIESITTSVADGTTLTLDMPATKPDGDLYVAIVGKDDDPAMTAHSSWTNEIYNTNEGGNAGPTSGVWWRIGSNESASYAWTGDAEEWAGMVLRVSGFSTENIIDSSATAVDTSGYPTMPTITPTNSDCLILRVAAVDLDVFGEGWYPGTDTEITSQSGNGVSIAATYITSPPAGGSPTGTSDFTGGVSDSWVASTIAISAYTVSTAETVQKELSDSIALSEQHVRDIWADRAMDDLSGTPFAEQAVRDVGLGRTQADTIVTFADSLSGTTTAYSPFALTGNYKRIVRITTS